MSKCDIETDYCENKITIYERACKLLTETSCLECNVNIPVGLNCFELYYYANEDDENEDIETKYSYICADCQNAIDVFGLNSYGDFWEDLYKTIIECNADVELEKLDSLTPVNRQKVCKIIEEYLEEHGEDED